MIFFSYVVETFLEIWYHSWNFINKWTFKSNICLSVPNESARKNRDSRPKNLEWKWSVYFYKTALPSPLPVTGSTENFRTRQGEAKLSPPTDLDHVHLEDGTGLVNPFSLSRTLTNYGNGLRDIMSTEAKNLPNMPLKKIHICKFETGDRPLGLQLTKAVNRDDGRFVVSVEGTSSVTCRSLKDGWNRLSIIVLPCS